MTQYKLNSYKLIPRHENRFTNIGNTFMPKYRQIKDYLKRENARRSRTILIKNRDYCFQKIKGFFISVTREL